MGRLGALLVSAAVVAGGVADASAARAGTAPAPVPPGPAILHQPPATPPQLENRPGGVWRAPPILVSGTDEYRDGEYLYQGYLFDDHGAAGLLDATDPFVTKSLFAAKDGTLSYPTAPVYGHNAADLVELRVRPLASATAIRITLNALVDPALTAFTVAIGSSPVPHPWPAGAGVRSPASSFLTVHGSTATLTDASSGRVVTPAPTVVVDRGRAQVEVTIPHRAWDPGQAVVRMAAGVGLWDVRGGHYLQPGLVATATTPGGAAPSGAALFDVAFRFHEPWPDWNVMGVATTLVDAAVLEQVGQKCFWRDCAQAEALASGDLSGLSTRVDFGLLARNGTDVRHVPTSGPMDRILPSHFAFGRTIDPGAACGRFPTRCDGMFGGRLQPYQIYVPPGPAPSRGWGVTLQLHASGANYNQYATSRNQVEFAGRGPGSITLTPQARDPDGDYTDASEADVFEAWADVAAHYRLDWSRADVSGYSMGGGGTYKLLERWPDLFARGFAAAAIPYDHGFQGQWIASLRNDPIMTWVGVGDEGSAITNQEDEIRALETYGYRFAFDQFLTSDHLTIATNDEYAPTAAFLGDHPSERNPSHISYAVDRRNDFPAVGVVADHAYWLSGLTLRAPERDPSGIVDATSAGFGAGDPAPSSPASSLRVLRPGHHGPMPYLETTVGWSAPPTVARRDRLAMTLTNLASVTVDIGRADLDCAATIAVTTDGPVQVVVPACHRSLAFGTGTTTAAL